MKDLTKKEMSLIIVAISHMGSDSDYWDDFKGSHMPQIMKLAGIKSPKECGKVSDSAFKKLRGNLSLLQSVI